jgi:hypothetical protein
MKLIFVPIALLGVSCFLLARREFFEALAIAVGAFMSALVVVCSLVEHIRLIDSGWQRDTVQHDAACREKLKRTIRQRRQRVVHLKDVPLTVHQPRRAPAAIPVMHCWRWWRRSSNACHGRRNPGSVYFDSARLGSISKRRRSSSVRRRCCRVRCGRSVNVSIVSLSIFFLQQSCRRH